MTQPMVSVEATCPCGAKFTASAVATRRFEMAYHQWIEAHRQCSQMRGWWRR